MKPLLFFFRGPQSHFMLWSMQCTRWPFFATGATVGEIKRLAAVAAPAKQINLTTITVRPLIDAKSRRHGTDHALRGERCT